MRLVYQQLRDAAKDEHCVRCAADHAVGAHYTGARRQAYGGGFGIKVHDIVMADLCDACHQEMDALFRAAGDDKEKRWEHSEEMLHWCMVTIIRRIERGVLVVKGARVTA